MFWIGFAFGLSVGSALCLAAWSRCNRARRDALKNHVKIWRPDPEFERPDATPAEPSPPTPRVKIDISRHF